MMKIKVIGLIVYLSVSAVVTVAVAADMMNGSGIVRDESGTKLMMVGGAVRCCPWKVIDDDKHDPVNLRASTADGRIRLAYPKSSRVVTLTVTPDETLVRKGYSAGATVRRDGATVFCARYGHPVDCRALAGSASNLWVSGFMKK